MLWFALKAVCYTLLSTLFENFSNKKVTENMYELLWETNCRGDCYTALDPAGEQDCLGTLQLLDEAHPIGLCKEALWQLGGMGLPPQGSCSGFLKKGCPGMPALPLRRAPHAGRSLVLAKRPLVLGQAWKRECLLTPFLLVSSSADLWLLDLEGEKKILKSKSKAC